jgi:hypothetical protein
MPPPPERPFGVMFPADCSCGDPLGKKEHGCHCHVEWRSLLIATGASQLALNFKRKLRVTHNAGIESKL